MRALVVVALVVACGQPAPTASPVTQLAGTPSDSGGCDVGDHLFATRAALWMWGRRPLSLQERDELAERANAEGRAGLVRWMASAPEYRDRWRNVLLDVLLVARNGEMANEGCFAAPLLDGVTSDLAAHVRDNPPDGPAFGQPWNLIDLINSSLTLGDLSPLYRGNLFTMLGSSVHDPSNPNNELGYRRLYADTFLKAYVGRRMECLRCHNSTFSVTDSPDPELDRAWPIEGRFEEALFGDPTGADPYLLISMFRVHGVLSLEFQQEGPDFWVYGPGARPWGLSPTCGQFIPKEDVDHDPLNGHGAWVTDHDDHGSIWDIEELMNKGFEQLRSEGLVRGADQSVAGASAAAWLASTRLVNAVWTELTGHPLTLVHGFPRNRQQRDVLESLTQTFVSSNFSLTEVLVTAITHPYLSQQLPSECGGPAYPMPPLFDPWSIHHEDADERGNSTGDLVLAVAPRVVLTAVAAAMEWTSPPDHLGENPGQGENRGFDQIAQLLRDVGVALNTAEAGFRGTTFQSALAWETAIGGCTDPFGEAGTPDYISALTQQDGTLGDAVMDLKERLITRRTIDAEEARLLQRLAGADLETPLAELSDADGALRRVCVALLRSPQVQLQGLEHTD